MSVVAKCESRRWRTAQATKNAPDRPARRSADPRGNRVRDRIVGRAKRRGNRTAQHRIADLIARDVQIDGWIERFIDSSDDVDQVHHHGEYMKNFDPIAAARTSRRSVSAGPITKCSSMWKWYTKPPTRGCKNGTRPRPPQSRSASTRSVVSSHLYQAVAPARSGGPPGAFVADAVGQVLQGLVETGLLTMLHQVLQNPNDAPRPDGVLGSVEHEEPRDPIEIQHTRRQTFRVPNGLREILVRAEPQEILVRQFRDPT